MCIKNMKIIDNYTPSEKNPDEQATPNSQKTHIIYIVPFIISYYNYLLDLSTILPASFPCHFIRNDHILSIIVLILP